MSTRSSKESSLAISPVEQPIKFGLVLNLKTAKQIGPDNTAERDGAGGPGDQVAGARSDVEIRENITWQIAYAETDI